MKGERSKFVFKILVKKCVCGGGEEILLLWIYVFLIIQTPDEDDRVLLISFSFLNVKNQQKVMSDFPGKTAEISSLWPFFFFVAKKNSFFIFSNFPKKSHKNIFEFFFNEFNSKKTFFSKFFSINSLKNIL